jgi:hypothetical protein
MAVIITNQKYASFGLNIASLGTDYTITNLDATSKPSANGDTVFDISMPVGYKYSGNFLLYLSSDSSKTPIVPDSSVLTVGATSVSVSYVTTPSSKISINTNYTIELDVQSV